MSRYDYIQEAIAEYATSISWEDLPIETVLEAKRRLLDSIAVSAASLRFKPVQVLRKAFLGIYEYELGSTIWFSRFSTIPEYAGLVNSTMTRALDFNDTYLSKEPLHPSDMIGVLAAALEDTGSHETDLLTAIAVGYEVGVRLCDSASLRIRGWDHVNFTMIAAVAALSNLLKLSMEQAAEALSIAVVPHVAMRQTRAGRITMWKASAAADACRHAMYASYLARAGYEGPAEPFTGEMGFINQLGIELDPAPIKELRERPEPTGILRTYMKFHPVEYHAQSAVDAVLELLGGRPLRPEEIERVEVYTVQATYDIIAKHPEKWRPENRETADHSLPYIVAYTLLHGDIWLDAYDEDNLRSEDIKRVMAKMDVKVDPELDRLYPREVPNRVVVRLRDGTVLESLVTRPRGYPGSGYDVDDLLRRKVFRLMRPYYPDDIIEEIINLTMNIDRYNYYELLELLVI